MNENLKKIVIVALEKQASKYILRRFLVYFQVIFQE